MNENFTPHHGIGVPVPNNQHYRSAGLREPLALDDFHLIEKLAHTNSAIGSRLIQRTVHG